MVNGTLAMAFNSIKLLIILFILGGLLLWLLTAWRLGNSDTSYVLLGVYTWSSSAFIIYRTYRLTKQLKNTHGTLKKQ